MKSLQEKIRKISILAIVMFFVTAFFVLIVAQYDIKRLGLYAFIGLFVWLGLTALLAADAILESEYTSPTIDLESKIPKKDSQEDLKID